MRSRMWCRHAGAWLIGIALGSTACGDTSAAPDVSPQRLQGAGREPLALAATDTTWDYFRSDLTLTFEGGGFVDAPAPPRRVVKLRVERHLGPDSQWVSRTSFLDSPAPGSFRRLTASSAVSDSSGLRLLDAAGGLMHVPRQIATLRPEGVTPSPRPTFTRASSREWLDHIVLSPASKDRLQTRIRNALGPPAARSGNLTTYRASRGERTAEFILNESLGAVEEFRVSRGSVVEARVTYAYELVSDGVYVRRTTRAVSGAIDPRIRERGMEVRVDSLRFERRGGQ